LLEKLDRTLWSRAIVRSPESAPSKRNDTSRFSLAHQPVNIVPGYEARGAYGHNFGAASPTTDLDSSDLESIEQYAVPATPPTKSPNPPSRLYSYFCSHGLLQSHLGFLRHLV
jgi:hypothetical protein